MLQRYESNNTMSWLVICLCNIRFEDGCNDLESSKS